MSDHVFVSVSDLDRPIDFYEKARAPLAIRHAIDYDGTDGPKGHPDLKGFGRGGRVFFWAAARRRRCEGSPCRLCRKK